MYTNLPREDFIDVITSSSVLVLVSVLSSVALAVDGNPQDPFFDCAHPKTDVQQVVCGNTTLLTMDQNLSDIYLKFLIALPEEKTQHAKQEQSQWLKLRDTRCAGYVPT